MRIPTNLKFDSNAGKARYQPDIFGCSKVEWRSEIPQSGKVNNYVCRFQHTTVTIHADEGVTPFMIQCHFCGETATSSFYQCNQTPSEIHGVWSKEPNSWWGDKSAQDDHASNGGVFLYAAKRGSQ